MHVFRYIRQELFHNPKVVTLTFLAILLSTYMYDEGIAAAKGSTRKHIQRKLRSEFIDALYMCPDKSIGLPIYFNDNDLAKENHQLKKDLESTHNTVIRNIIFN